jgi:hypothetical protein
VKLTYAWMSGHCGINRHRACLGIYAGTECPCPCHDLPELLADQGALSGGDAA